jgi:hypothetical protein
MNSTAIMNGREFWWMYEGGKPFDTTPRLMPELICTTTYLVLSPCVCNDHSARRPTLRARSWLSSLPSTSTPTTTTTTTRPGGRRKALRLPPSPATALPCWMTSLCYRSSEAQQPDLHKTQHSLRRSRDQGFRYNLRDSDTPE